MQIRFLTYMSIVALLFSSTTLTADPLRNHVKDKFAVIPHEPPNLPGNPTTPQKLALGEMLFFDPRLSVSHSISCASCHNLSLAGTDNRSRSLGTAWQQGGRNAPTVLNSVYNFVQFWDGRAADLAQQAGGPIQNPVEMGSTEQKTVDVLKGIPGYVDAFKAAFPDRDDVITFDNVEKAIAVFETILTTPDAPFDRWLRGDDRALTQDQKEGLRLFVDKGCSNCHNGVNIGGGTYDRFGVVKAPSSDIRPPDDLGRGAITHSVSDNYVFKVPTLRNIALTAPYFHSGQVWDLRQAVKIMSDVQLGVQLTDTEANQIVAFLNSLTGRPPFVPAPDLPPTVTTTPRPVP
ncbi:cytochrome-c peroxidase [Beijerinckia indica]|uniref:Cytochrome-c peroxidase n=1 Tax=Beijerinckia indica subsp. indica (strain ATCC 9039 / DSM 1715 / NCIMB 8712) TaxID=395963 RepID=B2IIV9_BEII9|nr:cytochrome-c peroxidase [Beijerinckia indica]ACB96171.1 Cytochrome-c peroxidase [Beijerinckia indica subsp. indica ATCC 9039]